MLRSTVIGAVVGVTFSVLGIDIFASVSNFCLFAVVILIGLMLAEISFKKPKT